MKKDKTIKALLKQIKELKAENSRLSKALIESEIKRYMGG